MTNPAMELENRHLQDDLKGCLLEMFASLLADTSGESGYVQSPNLIIDVTGGTNRSSTESLNVV